MSLINDALKKAERMRREQGGEPAGDGQPSATRPEKKGSSVMLVAGVAVGATVLVCASVIVTLRYARKPVESIPVPATQRAIDAGDTPSVVSAKPRQTEPAVLLDAKPEPEPAGHTSSAASPSIVIPAAVEDKPAPRPAAAQAPAPGALTPPSPSTPASPASAPMISLAAVTQALAPAAKPGSTEHVPGSPAVQAFVNNLKIMGIRASGNESRVLMNDRVYRVNDVVDRSLGLRLIEVSDDRLVFEDNNGARYFRNF